MPEITKIEVQEKNKTRANLYLDDKFFCGIAVELCVKHNLKKGIDIDENFLQEIVFEDEKCKAMNKAVSYISSTLKTAKQIRDYLKKKEYSQITIDYVIDKMKEYKYLDDEAYARAFINTYSNKYGKMKLKSALRSKGIKDDIIESVLSEDLKIESSLSKVAEKYLKNKEIGRETLNKLSRFLYSRGYEFDEINSYISALLKNK
jgi:regulatory protein